MAENTVVETQETPAPEKKESFISFLFDYMEIIVFSV